MRCVASVSSKWKDAEMKGRFEHMLVKTKPRRRERTVALRSAFLWTLSLLSTFEGGCGASSSPDEAPQNRPTTNGSAAAVEPLTEPTRCDEGAAFGEFPVKAGRWNAVVRGLPADAARAAATLERVRAEQGLLLELNGIPERSTAESLGGHLEDTAISDATFLFRSTLTPPAGPGVSPEFDTAYEATETNSVTPIRGWTIPSGATPVALDGDELVVTYTASPVCSQVATRDVEVWLSVRSDGTFRVRPPQSIASLEDVAGPGEDFGDSPPESARRCTRLRPFRGSAYTVCARVPSLSTPGARRLIFWQLPMT